MSWIWTIVFSNNLDTFFHQLVYEAETQWQYPAKMTEYFRVLWNYINTYMYSTYSSLYKIIKITTITFNWISVTFCRINWKKQMYGSYFLTARNLQNWSASTVVMEVQHKSFVLMLISYSMVMTVKGWTRFVQDNVQLHSRFLW